MLEAGTESAKELLDEMPSSGRSQEEKRIIEGACGTFGSFGGEDILAEIVSLRPLSHSSVTTRIAMAVAIAPPMSTYCSNGNAPVTPAGFTVNLTEDMVDHPALS